jgi:hypothetical protein
MRHLQTLHTKYSSKGLVILGFNCADDKKIAVEFLGENGATFPTILDSSAKIPGIPMKTRPDLWYCTTDKMKGGVPWRTQVHIEHFTKDRFISRLSMESIRDGILEKYSEAMRRRGSAVSIIFTDEQGNRRTTEVRPKDYEGEKLPEWTFTDRDSGTTCVRLYLAKATARGREGKVKVGESGNDFRIGFSMFHRNLPSGCKLADEVVSALTSGIFEGEILSGKAKFTANRHAFETSDALIGFASAIESWFQETGTQHYRLAVEAKREERYQDIGLSSMRVLDGLLADNAGIPLSEVIASFKRGSIGEGHFDRPGRDSTPPAMSVEGGRTGNDGGREGVRGDPRKEHEGHRPLTVQGPKGKPRRIVCHGSLGLQLTHEALESERLFILDTQDGVLTINTRHPDWVRVEEEGTPTSLGRFEEFILMTSLEIAALPEDFRDVASLAIERMITAYAFLAAHADRIAGRMPGRKPGSSVVPVDQPPKVMKKAAGS